MTRTVLFVSHHHGYALLSECLRGELSKILDVVAVASDDPQGPFSNAEKRLWRFPHERFEETMVVDLATQYGIETFVGNIDTKEVIRRMRNVWCPEISLMAVYDQILSNRILTIPKCLTYNFHPTRCEVEEDWPLFKGKDAMPDIIDGGHRWMNIVLHEAEEDVDGGSYVASSKRIYIPKGCSAMDVEKLSATAVADVARLNVPNLVKLDL